MPTARRSPINSRAMKDPTTGTDIALPNAFLPAAEDICEAASTTAPWNPCILARSVLRKGLSKDNDLEPAFGPRANTCSFDPEAVKHGHLSGCFLALHQDVRRVGVREASTIANWFANFAACNSNLYNSFHSLMFLFCNSVYVLGVLSDFSRH